MPKRRETEKRKKFEERPTEIIKKPNFEEGESAEFFKHMAGIIDVLSLPKQPYMVRVHAIGHLGQLAQEARTLKREIREKRLDVLRTVASPMLEKDIENLLSVIRKKREEKKEIGDTIQDILLHSMEALARIGGLHAMNKLIDCLWIKDPLIRKEAVKALKYSGEKRVVQPLVSIFISEKEAEDIREEAIISLAHLAQEGINVATWRKKTSTGVQEISNMNLLEAIALKKSSPDSFRHAFEAIKRASKQ